MWSGYSEKGTGSQERGPGTFTFNPPGGVPQAQGERATQVQGGIRGNSGPGNTAPAIRIPQAQEDQTLQALLKFGNDMIGPKLQEAKDARFIAGVQKAAAGKAMTEIVNEQPWYSKIFGDGPLVDGARAYSVQAKTEQWASAHEAKMGELRTRSPDEIPGYLMESMQQYLTGDEGTDALIKANLVKAVPSLIKRHTKEYYKLQQERASDARVEAIVSAGKRVQDMHGADPAMYTPEDRDAQKLNQLAIMTPTEGADPDAYVRDVSLAIGIHAEAGDFHAINNMRQAGVLAHMPPKERMALENQLNRYAAYHAGQSVGQYAERLAKLRVAEGAGTISFDEVGPAYDAINADYASRSGNTYPVIPKGEYMGGMVRAANTAISAKEQGERIRAAAAEKAAKEAAKVQDSMQAEGLVMGAILAGNAKIAKETGGNKLVDDTFFKLYRGAPPEQVMPLLASNAKEGYKNDAVQADIARVLNSSSMENMNDNFVAGYNLWRGMRRQMRPDGTTTERDGGYAATGAYIPELWNKRFAAFETILAGRDITKFGELAFQQSMQERLHPGHTFSKEEAKGVDSHLKSISSNWLGMGGLTNQAMSVARGAIARYYSNTSGTAEERTKEATARALASGLEIMGKHAWLTSPDRPKLSSYLGVSRFPGSSELGAGLTAADMGDVFNTTVEDIALRARGSRSADVQFILRLPDRDGMAQFQMFLQDTDPVGFTSDDIAATYARNKDAASQRKQTPAKVQTVPSMQGPVLVPPLTR